MFSILVNSLLIGYSGAMMPGSLLTYTIDKSLKSGARSGLLISIGHALLEFVVVVLILLGVGSFLASDPAQITIGFIGGIVLLYFGIGMLKDALTKKLAKSLDSITAVKTKDTEAGPADKQAAGAGPAEIQAVGAGPAGTGLAEKSSPELSENGRILAAGAIISASNPYFIFWWAAVGLGLILGAYRAFGIPGVAMFYIGHILADITWYSFISLLISRTSKFINIRIYTVVIAILGVCLIGFGGGFFINSIRLLLHAA